MSIYIAINVGTKSQTKPGSPLRKRQRTGSAGSRDSPQPHRSSVGTLPVIQVTHVKQKAKLNEPIGESLLCMIKYYVYPGREAEALKYLEEGFNETLFADKRSPLQFITRKYDDDDVENKIYSEEGAIVVQYRFKFNEEDNEELAFLNKLSSFNKLKVELLLKGFVSHTNKNRTNVKVDYSYVNIVGDELDTQLLNNMLFENELLPSEVAENPFFSTLMKAKKFHLALRLKSFRQMNRFYEEMS